VSLRPIARPGRRSHSRWDRSVCCSSHCGEILDVTMNHLMSIMEMVNRCALPRARSMSDLHAHMLCCALRLWWWCTQRAGAGVRQVSPASTRHSSVARPTLTRGPGICVGERPTWSRSATRRSVRRTSACSARRSVRTSRTKRSRYRQNPSQTAHAGDKHDPDPRAQARAAAAGLADRRPCRDRSRYRCSCRTRSRDRTGPTWSTTTDLHLPTPRSPARSGLRPRTHTPWDPPGPLGSPQWSTHAESP
jgi:hypothetical protein